MKRISEFNLPRYRLFTQSGSSADTGAGWWQFAVQGGDNRDRWEGGDEEEDLDDDRLELLAVVRGLESFDRPADVLLCSQQPLVYRGIRFGMPQWRENHWRWEAYGRWAAVPHQDLWQRIDRALGIHQVRAKVIRIDPRPAGDEGRIGPPRWHVRRRVPLGQRVASA